MGDEKKPKSFLEKYNDLAIKNKEANNIDAGTTRVTPKRNPRNTNSSTLIKGLKGLGSGPSLPPGYIGKR
jgi:hypothetical protein